jgi:murein DD-endopeptidase MepM/ murein hydrolase activator NlpD
MRNHSDWRGRRKGLPLAKILVVSLLLFGAFLLTGSANFLLGSISNFPLYSNIHEPNSHRLDGGPSCPVPDSSPCDVRPSPNGNPVEISDMTSDGDTLLSLFSLSFCDATAVRRVAESLASVIQADSGKRFRTTDELPPGKPFAVQLDGKSEFQEATIELGPSRVFHCKRENGVFKSWKEDVVLDYKTEVLCFKVQRGIVHSILAAHEGRKLVLKLMHIFRWDIDFQADVRRGDECEVVFERRYADDKPAGYGRILYAVYRGKRTGTKTACLFNGEYFDANGVELKRDYLRAPLNTLRITSGYGWRIHPILNIWKFHTGVDYGAPTGTPVYAIANGTVTFRGCGKAYGLYVCIRHENGLESRYSHLSRILVKEGQRVKQRQTIGLVGSTGRSTGHHLFFEIIANGKRIDPTKAKMVKNPKAVPAPLKDRFHTVINTQVHFLQRAAGGDFPRMVSRSGNSLHRF